MVGGGKVNSPYRVPGAEKDASTRPWLLWIRIESIA